MLHDGEVAGQALTYLLVKPPPVKIKKYIISKEHTYPCRQVDGLIIKN